MGGGLMASLDPKIVQIKAFRCPHQLHCWPRKSPPKETRRLGSILGAAHTLQCFADNPRLTSAEILEGACASAHAQIPCR